MLSFMGRQQNPQECCNNRGGSDKNVIELNDNSIEIINKNTTNDDIDTMESTDDIDSARAQKRYNTFAAKKTVAQGMMDIALLTANANQLRYLIEYNSHSATFWLNVILIGISLILQLVVGVCLIFKGRYDIKGQSKQDRAHTLNNFVVVSVFLITIINVFVASFTTSATALDVESIMAEKFVELNKHS